MEQSFQKGVVLHLASLIEYTEGAVSYTHLRAHET